MTKATRRGILAVVTCILLPALGLGVGLVVGDALGIRTESSEQMTPAAPVVPTITAAVAPPEFTAIDAPDTVRVDEAIIELQDAVADASERAGAASLTVRVSGDAEDDTYLLTGTPDALRIEAAGETGAVRGVYDLAAHIRAGRSVAAHLGEEVTSRLPLRMVDLGAVAVDPDPAQWTPGTDYSHASKAFADVMLPEAPYIDGVALEAAYTDFDEYLTHSMANGYNAVAFPGFVEFVTFDDAPGGAVYAEGDEHRAKVLAMRDAFGPFWDRAEELGMKVYLRTDMLTLTTPLEQYLTDRFGSLDTADPELWDVYAAGLDELYAAEPALDGVLIRIGEAGRVYDVDGWDVYSALAVTTVDSVRAMLETLTAQAEASDREVIFRTWSVGVGAVGDMHTNDASYEAVLGGIDSPALVVSTKYTLGDFYSWLPLNTTLEQGEQRRIIEFQSRREFENFGAFPNDLGPEYQFAVQKLLDANDRIEGIWTWTQDGGPWRAGPMSLHLEAGFWQLYELDTLLAVDLARDPGADVGEITADWGAPVVLRRSGDGHRDRRGHGALTTGDPAGDVHPAVRRAARLRDRPRTAADDVDLRVGHPHRRFGRARCPVRDLARCHRGRRRRGDRGRRAGGGGCRAHARSDRVDGCRLWRDAELRELFTGTMDYEVDSLRLLSSYRAMILHQAQWHDTLSADAQAAWQADRDVFEQLAAEHLDRYEGNVDFPAFNLTAAELGVERADRDSSMAWLARVLLALAAAWVLIGMLAARTRLVRRPGAAAARAAWLGATRPWRARESTLGMLSLDRWLLLVVPGALLVATRAVQTSFLSWVHLAVVFGAWIVFVLVVRLCVGRRSPWPVIAAVGGVVVLRCALTLFALSFTGPGGYWFAFWTDPVLRTAYITVAFALFLWVFVAAGWALSAQVGGRRATGFVLAAVGAGLAVPATVVAVIGLETSLTAWNDELGLLPWGLSRILGITVYLDIPGDAAWFAAAFGVLVAAVGVLLAVPWRRRSRAGSVSAS